MSPRKSNLSPIGTSASEAQRRRARRSPDYRAAQERLAPYEAIARFVIQRRAELDLTQEQLAERMGTSHSAISRIESGQHRTSVATLQRLAEALEVRFVMGFESGPPERARAGTRHGAVDRKTMNQPRLSVRRTRSASSSLERMRSSISSG